MPLCPAEIHPSRADFNHDGRVDLADLAEFASAWLWESSCETALTANRGSHYTGTTDNSYWYVFIPDYGTPGTTIDYLFSLLNGAVGYTVRIYDDCGGIVLGTANSSFTVIPLATGDSYYIEIENTGGATDDYDLYIDYGGEGI